MAHTGLKVIVVALAALIVINVVAIALLYGRHPVASPAPSVPSVPVAASLAVDAALLPAPCSECFDATQFKDALTNAGVKFGTVMTYQPGSPEATSLIAKYGITQLPALVLSKELSSYDQVASGWSQVGTIAPDGSYLFQGVVPPYYDLATKRVRGLVTLVILNDSSCPGCFNSQLFGQAFSRLALNETRTVDVQSAEGKALVVAYNITTVPTALLRGDLAAYAGFDQAWSKIGTVASDGTYVFTAVATLQQPYKDLVSGALVVPLSNTTNATG